MPALEISAVIPAFNEEQAVGAVIDGLAETLKSRVERHEILVIDDGSTDKTAEIARAHGATVLRHPVNRGYGRSLITGFNAAKHDWVLMIDADGSYPPSEAAKLVETGEGFDMIVGARRGRLFWGPPVQSLLRWIYLSIAGFIAGEHIPDANSGLRLVRKRELSRCMPLLCLGYSFTTTMTLSFIQGGRFVAFVPIEFAERRGRSKVRPLRDILRTLQTMTQVMVFYNPLKLTVALSCLLLCLGAAASAALWALGGSGLAVEAVLVFAGLALGSLLLGWLLESLRMLLADRDGGLLSR